MISFQLDEHNGVLTVWPRGKLELNDFQELSGAVDPFIRKRGNLTGLMIVTERFPGWKDLDGMIANMKFVKSHHMAIMRIALVTDTKIADAAEFLGKYFLKASVRHFPVHEIEAAQHWIASGQKEER
jgi:hypothetical protein